MVDWYFAWSRGGHAPSSGADSTGGKAGKALVPGEAGPMRRVQAPIRGGGNWRPAILAGGSEGPGYHGFPGPSRWLPPASHDREPPRDPHRDQEHGEPAYP